MLKCILTVGIPGSGKSTWAKSEIAKDPSNWVRVNNDDIRAMCNGSVWSADYEKLIGETRKFLIREAFKRDKNVIVDNLNAGKRHFDDVCATAKAMNKDIQVFEKSFYVDLETAIERDSKREGSARVGPEVVKKWFKQLGGKQHAFYKPRVEIYNKLSTSTGRGVKPMAQDSDLEKCAIFDLDGTMCEISHRNPYDASNCDKDSPNEHVVNLCKLFSDNGYKIFFFSGREDKHMGMTVVWLDKYFGKSYDLFMRETDNKEDDRLLKERLFNTHIKDKYLCKAWVDDRLRVCKFIHEAGLPLFRVGPPDADF